MAVIFPFEVELYEKADVAVEFTGHPLVDEIVPDKDTVLKNVRTAAMQAAEMAQLEKGKTLDAAGDPAIAAVMEL